jgi:hypothetical protein
MFVSFHCCNYDNNYANINDYDIILLINGSYKRTFSKFSFIDADVRKQVQQRS